MKLCILVGTPNTFETQHILQAALDSGHSAVAISIFDIYFEIKNDVFTARHKDIELLDYDVFLFRGIASSNLGKTNLYNYLILAKYFYDNNKVVVDKKLAVNQYIASKISYSRAKSKIPTPNTVQTFGEEMTLKYLNECEYPLIIKSTTGSKGRGVFLANSIEEAKKIIQENESKSFMFQEYIPSRFDIRVFVVGDKVLGAMRRDAAENDFRSNIAQGGSASIYDLSKDHRIAKLALDACKAAATEIAGVDIMINEQTNNLYVLEVNRSPQFKGFFEATGIHVGKEIFEYCLQQFNSK